MSELDCSCAVSQYVNHALIVADKQAVVHARCCGPRTVQWNVLLVQTVSTGMFDKPRTFALAFQCGALWCNKGVVGAVLMLSA